MYKLCVAFAAMLAVAAAKPSLGYSYPAAYSSYVAPVATSYSAYPAAAVYPAHSVYSAPVYSSYASAAPVATTYAAAPVAAVAAPVATYASAAYPAYPNYAAPVAYTNEIPTSFLWKKK